MSSQNDQNVDVPRSTAPEHGDKRNRPGVSRRVFLQSALLGAAGVPIAGSIASSVAAQGTGHGAATPAAVAPEAIASNTPETWIEPWIWRPSDWPGQSLDLNVVENQNPGPVVGYGNPSAVLFSYNGSTPGPTIRMRGDETLYVKLRNLLGENSGTTDFGPYPDLAALPPWVSASDVKAKSEQLGNARLDFCLGEHTNGVHSARVTNLHTHGLHVRPGRNPDGTHSDNVIFRLIDQADLERREAQANSPTCVWLRGPDQNNYLRSDEQIGHADYEFRIGNVQAKDGARLGLPPQPHPPGTHWYHPHAHGATHNQVASGMAGFLIIEGDVDAAINQALTGVTQPNPQLKTGPYDYIERTMLIQRVFVISTDPDAHTKDLKQGGAANPVINGDQDPKVITMRPGAIERWRILNGSVDGRGFNRFMVLKGQYVVEEQSTGGATASTLVKLRDAATNTFSPATRAEISADKQRLYHLAFDGVTLMETNGENVSYTIRDLSEQNPDAANPLDRELSGNPNRIMLDNLEACFADADGLRNCYVQPNEIYFAPANRSDVFFQAPRLEPDAGQSSPTEIYTILAQGELVHSDDYQSALQSNYSGDTLAPLPEDIVIAHIVVSEGTDADGNPLPSIPDFDVMDLIDTLPPVPQYLQPITDSEIQVKAANDDFPGDPDSDLPDRVGKYRTRTITYSGWGSNDFPLVTTVGDSDTARNFREFVERDQANGGELELLQYAEIEETGEYVLLAPNIRSMAISGSASDEVINASDPLFPITKDMARKFDPHDPQRPRMLEGTAEEWTLYNSSISLWADSADKPPGQSGGHYPGQPLLRAEGQARFSEQPADNKTWMLTSKGVDHPFHMHQNPFWVSRIEVPNEHGNLVNILDHPRWQDVVWIPRNGGRVVFRSRFPDYVGAYVNHCHILLHEDHGMMQVVEVTPFSDQADYEMKDRVTSVSDSAEDVTEIYPRRDQAGAWRQSMRFVDSNHATGQLFPGFEVDPPTD
jgi:FtsP/CotA-like multicopper oxidase with cupredoxin domain